VTLLKISPCLCASVVKQLFSVISAPSVISKPREDEAATTRTVTLLKISPCLGASVVKQFFSAFLRAPRLSGEPKFCTTIFAGA
jgi:hypothetical protein